MTTKRCPKGLKKDKSSGKCVTLGEFNARKKRSVTLKKMDKNKIKYDMIKQKVDAAHKDWSENIEYTKTGNETSKSYNRNKVMKKLEKELSKNTAEGVKLETLVADIEDAYDIHENSPY